MCSCICAILCPFFDERCAVKVAGRSSSKPCIIAVQSVDSSSEPQSGILQGILIAKPSTETKLSRFKDTEVVMTSREANQEGNRDNHSYVADPCDVPSKPTLQQKRKNIPLPKMPQLLFNKGWVRLVRVCDDTLAMLKKASISFARKEVPLLTSNSLILAVSMYPTPFSSIVRKACWDEGSSQTTNG